VVPEFPDLPYREVIVSPYRFFYRIKEATVWVVAVCHGAQPPEEPMSNGALQGIGCASPPIHHNRERSLPEGPGRTKACRRRLPAWSDGVSSTQEEE